jgi:hypothetical protein
MVIPVHHGITADKAQLAIDSQSVLQKQDGIINAKYGSFPVGKIKRLTSYRDTDENLSGQVEVRGS